MQTPAGEMAMSGVYQEVVEQEKNVVGGYTCEHSIEGATGILDSFERHLDEETR